MLHKYSYTPFVFPGSGMSAGHSSLYMCVCVPPQGMHPAFIGAQYPFSVATGPQPPMAATAVTFPGVPVPSMTQIAVHPYHTETGLPLSTTVAGEDYTLCVFVVFCLCLNPAIISVLLNLGYLRYCTLVSVIVPWDGLMCVGHCKTV